MEGIKTKVGFTGTLAQFFEHLRTDPKFKPASREALRDGYYAIGRTVDARIREQFSTIPKSPLEIREVEPFREKTAAGGSYQQGTPDGSRPGIFYYNAYDLPSRRVWGMETLYLHEGSPGHHFQISLAQENEALPAFMRFGGNTAYVEGWALYAETLWDELGMETDPYQRFGGLNDEMLRAMRLVVDSGIHAKGWGRDQAIDYMLANSGMSRTEATAEVERYIAIPSQALAYKIGALTILRLKAKAQKELGARFDPREFHAQVLMTGSLPMAVLEKKIDDWIKSKKSLTASRGGRFDRIAPSRARRCAGRERADRSSHVKKMLLLLSVRASALPPALGRRRPKRRLRRRRASLRKPSASLFAASDEASLRRNPLNALARGDMRYAGRLGDFLSDSYYRCRSALAAEQRARGARPDRPGNVLTPVRAHLLRRVQMAARARSARPSARYPGLDRGSADRPFQRLPRPVRAAQLRREHRPVQDRRRL